MNSANTVEHISWDDIIVEEKWGGPPKRKPHPLVSALKKNLLLICLCALAFAAGMIPGYVFFEETKAQTMPALEGLANKFSLEEPKHILAIKIFVNNATSSIFLLVGGTLLFVPLLILAANGFLVGFVLRAFLEKGYSLPQFLAVILGHGILELPALFIAAAVGIRIGLSYLIPKGGRVNDVAGSIKSAAAVYLTIVLPLLLAAAFIEAYVSSALVP
jgi:stage II sporulation protein M